MAVLKFRLGNLHKNVDATALEVFLMEACYPCTIVQLKVAKKSKKKPSAWLTLETTRAPNEMLRAMSNLVFMSRQLQVEPATNPARQELASTLADSFYHYLKSDPELLKRASDREEVGRLFQEFVNKEVSPDTEPELLRALAKRRQLEAVAMSILRQRKLLKSKRFNDKVVMVFARTKPGDFPTIKEQKVAREWVLLRQQEEEADKEGVAVTMNALDDLLPTRVSTDIAFQIRAEDPSITLLNVQVRGAQKEFFQVVADTLASLPVSTDGEVSAVVSFQSKGTGVYRGVVDFNFHSSVSKDFSISRYLTVRTGDAELQNVLKPMSPYKKRVRKRDPAPSKVVHAPPLDTSRDEVSLSVVNVFAKLPHHKVPSNVRQLIMNQEMECILEKPNASNLVDTYSTFWKNLLWTSELQAYEDIKVFDMEGAKLKREGKYFSLEVPGLAEGRPSVLRGDLVNLSWNGSLFKGRVHRTRLLEVLMELHPSFCKRFNHKLDTVHVRFTFGRTIFRTAHEGCQVAPSTMRQTMLLPSSLDVVNSLLKDRTRQVDVGAWANRNLNSQQKQAVSNIVAGKCRPLPYIIFGPPGTGKTTTVVETVYQLAKQANLKVLLVAPSNDAADILVEKLAPYFPPSEMTRVLAYSRSIDSVAAAVKPYVTEMEGLNDKEIGRSILWAQVAVSTVNLAARFSYFGVERGHFDALCVDEAGHATEPEVVAVACTLFDFYRDEPGQLILAGDPRQLGPVITSDVCRKFGMSVSYMERLSKNTDVYGRIGVANEYPHELISKLVQNYRSHPSILKLPNEMFYDGELQTCGDVMKTHSMAKWEYLPAPDFPVVFHSVHGENLREGDSPSWFNPQEAEEVVGYVDLLVNQSRPQVSTEDIGVITPYARQAQKIRLALKTRGIEDVKVGSVETFQGQERRCIVVSTVRAETEFVASDLKYNLGFVANEKRFNVAVTRAQGLLVVIGNPKVLALDKKNWLPFLKYCRSNQSWAGQPWDDESDDEDGVGGGEVGEGVPSEAGDDEAGDDIEWDLIDRPSEAAEQEAYGFINREE